MLELTAVDISDVVSPICHGRDHNVRGHEIATNGGDMKGEHSQTVVHGDVFDSGLVIHRSKYTSIPVDTELVISLMKTYIIIWLFLNRIYSNLLLRS
jgi:hypothetical protein